MNKKYLTRCFLYEAKQRRWTVTEQKQALLFLFQKKILLAFDEVGAQGEISGGKKDKFIQIFMTTSYATFMRSV